MLYLRLPKMSGGALPTGKHGRCLKSLKDRKASGNHSPVKRSNIWSAGSTPDRWPDWWRLAAVPIRPERLDQMYVTGVAAFQFLATRGFSLLQVVPKNSQHSSTCCYCGIFARLAAEFFWVRRWRKTPSEVKECDFVKPCCCISGFRVRGGPTNDV